MCAYPGRPTKEVRPAKAHLLFFMCSNTLVEPANFTKLGYRSCSAYPSFGGDDVRL